MAKKHAISGLAKPLAKAKPDKAYALLYQAFVFLAAAGDVARAGALLERMYRTPPATLATALSTQALDAFCAAAGLGDRTGGRPTRGDVSAPIPELAERAIAGERMVRWRMITDRYAGQRLPRADWTALPTTDPWRRIHQWRELQEAVTPTADGDASEDAAALPLAIELLDGLGASDRGPGHGDELTIGIDLALRHGREDLARGWIARFAPRLREDTFQLEIGMCLSPIANAMARGLFRDAMALPEAERAAAMDAIDAALGAAAARVPAEKVPKVQKRRVSCEYGQLYVEPETRTPMSAPYFDDPRESPQGMSLLATRVAIGTPTNTDHADVEITTEPAGPVDLEGVVQAVAFPLLVEGPLCLRSVSSDDRDDEPFTITPGRYDVLARFVPKKAGKTGLRVFALRLGFRPPGSLDAPKCLRLEDGTRPATIFTRSLLQARP